MSGCRGGTLGERAEGLYVVEADVVMDDAEEE